MWCWRENSHMKRWLSVARDMRHDSLEDLRLIALFCAILDIEVLKLEFLSPKIVAKSPEGAGLVFLSAFIGKLMVRDALLHRSRVLLQATPHVG